LFVEANAPLAHLLIKEKPMKKLTISLLTVFVLFLTACSGTATSADGGVTQTPVAPATASTPKASPTPTSTEAKSVRGNTIKKLGDTVRFTDTQDPNSTLLGTLAVTDISDVACTNQYASKPTNGKVIGLTVDLETKPELANSTMKMLSITPFDFKYIAPNGTTFNGNLGTAVVYSCIDNSQVLGSSYGPSEKAHGIILLDVPSSGGVLTLGHVEWNLP
jgi:hypothetical protein